MNNLTSTKSRAISTQTAVDKAIGLWAKATTNSDSERFNDMRRDKTKAVESFFSFVGKNPQDMTPDDVDRWLDSLRDSGLATATIYARASMVSSFYTWLMTDDTLRQFIPHNPVTLARPETPKPYKGAQSLDDNEIARLLDVVRAEAADKLTARRDYAMLLFYILTGHRRAEVCRLTWGDLKRNGKLTVRFLVKGGDYVTEEVNPLCWDALIDYLKMAGRLDTMTADTPLWVGHDRAGQAAGALSSHAFAKNLKRYARLAGIDEIHVHQLRHTVARMVGDDTGDLTAVQKVLGHKNLATTRVYAKQIMTKRDTHSQAIADRLGLGE